MGNVTVLALCDSGNDLGRLIHITLAGMSDLAFDITDDLDEMLGKLATQDYACVVIDAEVGQGFERNAPLSHEVDGAALPPFLYIVQGVKDVDRLLHQKNPGQVDVLLNPTCESILKNRVQILLELEKQKKSVSVYKKESEARSLELEVLHKELLEKNYQLELLSSLDSLTGLFNRYYFDENLQKEWRQAVRQDESLSLLFIDVDLLKLYNEYYGRIAGDDLLRELAVALHGALLRPVDIVARYGGDQFAVILPGTNKAGAKLVATRMLENVDALKKEHLGCSDSGQVSISIGGATMHPLLVDKVTELIKMTENALEEAKRAGRHRVFHK